MNFVESEDNLVDFLERFLKLRYELDYKDEALMEDKEVGRRVGINDGLIAKGLNFTPMETMLWIDRSFIWSYPVLKSGELFMLGSIQSHYHAKKTGVFGLEVMWSQWRRWTFVLIAWTECKFFYQYTYNNSLDRM